MAHRIDDRGIWRAAGLVALIGLGGFGIAAESARQPAAAPQVASAVSEAAKATVLAGVDAVASGVDAVTEMPSSIAEVVAAANPVDEEALAREIARRKARDAEQMVAVIRAAFDAQQPEIPLTFLLAIAYNETHGKVLAVSPAGAVGLAQATPAAYLSEAGFDGKVYITNQYLMAARSYIMKKPLGDAVGIAGDLIERNTPQRRARAEELLAAAYDLQREGMDELEVLEPHAPELFTQRIGEADARNTRALDELAALIDRGAPKGELLRYRDRQRKEFRAMMATQQSGWTSYQKELEGKRDRLLRARYGMDPVQVIQTRGHEAGEYLAQELDARFSPSEAARFLAAHLTTKQQQALAMGIEDAAQLEQWTAALYNGGAVNIKRMRAGLMGSLTETQNYMRKIPQMRAELDRVAWARRS